MGFVIVALLLGFVGAVVACAAAAAAFALATSVATSKYKKQLHGVTARYEAVLRNADAGGLGPGAPTAASGAAGGAAGGAAAGGPGGGAGAGGGVAAMYESFTLGWLNLLVQHLWVPVLEKFVSTLAAERLQVILNEVLRKFATRAPWKFIESVAVEEVTFGLAPPQFQFCTAKYDPSRSYLLLTMNMHYHSSGFQAVLTPRMRQIGLLQPFSVRLEIMQLHIAGKLHLGLHLTKEPPGIKGIDYSFAAPPEFDIQASPVGYLNLHGELPGLVGHLRTHLQRIITRRLVEPHRRYLDLQRIYRNKHLQRVGGPGGCLRVCVIGGRNLMGARAGAAGAAGAGAGATGGGAGPNAAASGAAGSAAAPDCDPYVELRFGREVFRTPIAHHTADPVFNWQFDLRLPADLASAGPSPAAAAAAAGGDPVAAAAAAGAAAAAAAAGNVVLHFRVLNARTIGEPEILSTGTLDVGTLALQPNGDPRARLLELSALGPGASSGGAQAGPQAQAFGASRGTLSLQVCWLKAAAKRGSPFPQDAARTAAIAAAAAAAAAAAGVAASAAVPPGVDPAAFATAAASAAGSGPGLAVPGMHRHAAGGNTASPYSSSAGTTPAQMTPAPSFRSNNQGTPPQGTPPGAGRRGAGSSGAVSGGASGGDLAAMGAAEAVAAHASDVTGSRPMPPSRGDASSGATAGAVDASSSSNREATKSARGLVAAAAAVGGMFRRARPHPAVAVATSAAAGVGPGAHHSRQSSSDSSGLPLQQAAAGAHHGRFAQHATAGPHGGTAHLSRGPSRQSLTLASELTLSDGTPLQQQQQPGSGLNGHIGYPPHIGADNSGYTELCETVPEGASASASSTSSRLYTAGAAPVPAVGLVTPPSKWPGGPGGKGSSTGSGGKKQTAAAAVAGRHRRAISHILTLGHWRGIGGGSASSLPDDVSGDAGGDIASASKVSGKPGKQAAAAAGCVAVSATANGGPAVRNPVGSPDLAATKAAVAGNRSTAGISSPFRIATAVAAAAAAGGISATGRRVDTDGSATMAAPGSDVAARAGGENLQPAGGSNGVATMPPTPTPGASATAGAATASTAASGQHRALERDPLADITKSGGAPTVSAAGAAPPSPGLALYGESVPRESGTPTPLLPESSMSASATAGTTGAAADAPGNAQSVPARARPAHLQPPQHERNASSISDVSSTPEGLATISGGGQMGAAVQNASNTSLLAVAEATAASAVAAGAREATTERGGSSGVATNGLVRGAASGPQARANSMSKPAARSQVSTLFGLFGSSASVAAAAAGHESADASTSQAQKPPLYSGGSGRQPALAANSGGPGSAASGAPPLPHAVSGAQKALAHQRTVSGGSPTPGHNRPQHSPYAQGSPAVSTPLAQAGASGSVAGHGDGPSGAVSGTGYASGPPPHADLMSSFNAANVSPWQEPPQGAMGGLAAGFSGASHGAGAGVGGADSALLQSLAQVMKMHRLLQSERAARAEAMEMLSEVRRKYDAMVRLRRFENNRALVEGARFLLHLGRDVRRVVVWYNEPRGRVQVDPDTGGLAERGGGAGAAGAGSEPWPRSFQPQELERAERSATAFPNPSAWAGVMAAIMGRVRPPAPTSLDPLKCFSLYLEGGRALHLQLPPSGNGRSRDEWVDALQDIAARASRAAAAGAAAGAAAASGGVAAGSSVGREDRHSMAALTAAAGGGVAATAAKASRGHSGAGVGGT